MLITKWGLMKTVIVCAICLMFLECSMNLIKAGNHRRSNPDFITVRLNSQGVVTADDLGRLLQQQANYAPIAASKSNESLVAIIVPIRGREDQFPVFLKYMHLFLAEQDIVYRIYFISQHDRNAFNRGQLLNAGFIEAMADADWECVIFHDIDLLPTKTSNRYRCDYPVLHLASVRSIKGSSSRHYYGGVLAIKPDVFRRINGFPNSFFGWGHEDDELGKRLLLNKINVVRRNRRFGRYIALDHQSNKFPIGPRNKNYLLFAEVKDTSGFDGLNSTGFAVISRQSRQNYTNLAVLTIIQGTLVAEVGQVNESMQLTSVFRHDNESLVRIEELDLLRKIGSDSPGSP